MAIQFRRGIIFKRGIAKAADNIGRECPTRRRIRNPWIRARARKPKQPKIPPGATRARESPKQALTRRPMQLGVPPLAPLSRCHVSIEKERRRGGPGGGRPRSPHGRAEVPALCHGQDPSVADRAHGPQDALQCLRGPIQVGPARAGVSARCQPDFYADEALEFAPESDGAPEAEGGPEGPTTASATVYSSEHGL